MGKRLENTELIGAVVKSYDGSEDVFHLEKTFEDGTVGKAIVGAAYGDNDKGGFAYLAAHVEDPQDSGEEKS